MALEKMILCLLIADLLTGFAHWLEDAYGTLDMPVVGKLVVEANVEHHKRPGLMGTMGTWVSRNLQSFALAAAFVGLATIFGVFCWPILLVACFAALGNEVHSWNHRKDNHCIAAFLQDAGLVQSRQQHGLHHRPPYDDYFCTLTNFTNAVLHRLKFWSRLERLIYFVSGVEVKRMTQSRNGY